MKTDLRNQLIQELTDLLVVKVALAFVPVRNALEIGNRDDMASAIEGIVRSLPNELHTILADYDVFVKK